MHHHYQAVEGENRENGSPLYQQSENRMGQSVSKQREAKSRLTWSVISLMLGFLGFILVMSSIDDNGERMGQVQVNQEQVDLKTEIAWPNPDKTEVPNIIFLLIDDQGHGDMGYINEQLRGLMPNIVSLADGGIKFTQYYTESLCSPARAALMTGKYSIHTGMQHELIGGNMHWGLPLGNPILPEMMNKHGYVSRMVGKWHLGFFQPAYIPTNRGFVSHLGYYGGQENYYNHSYPTDHVVFYDWQRDGWPAAVDEEQDNGYSLTLFANEVDTILTEHDQSRPLFLYYATQATHAPLSDPPPHYLTEEEKTFIRQIVGNDRKNESLSQRELFLRTTVALDKSIGRMIDTLKATGMYENTIILAGSDNGGCAYYGGNNYPLRGEKRTQWEGGVRTNGFVHSPLLADDAKGTTFTNLFHVTDWVPTILYGILGNDTEADSRVFDGINQWEVIQGQKEPVRDQIIYNIEIMNTTTDSFITAYRDGPYKLVFGEVEMPIYSPIYLETYNYCESDGSFGNQTSFVFDILNDASEKVNIVEQLPDARLSAMWYAIDGFWTSSVKAAYDAETDFRYKKVWHDHGDYMVPWIYYKEDQERVHLPVPEDVWKHRNDSTSNDTDSSN